ncbi:probable cytochrome P450 9f2 [Anopheles maculipalpis]|uniref:probable cytochrome P450 9f2 n=1 Tax=Anopheles maculipalpis TaxID=1496333 RepID=UPI0021591E35|nr:probable cytochrome P450 9f2 [Anopheles maculipalpis]
MLGTLVGSLLTVEGALLVALVALLYYYAVVRNMRFFVERGVPYLPPVPLLGNSADFITRKRHITDVLSDMYARFGQHRFFGYFDFLSPIFVVRDMELVKQICIKDFDHFINHRIDLDENHDPLFGRALFAMRDTRWRNMRTVLSPAFTGSKMRLMFGLITTYCEGAMRTIRSEMGADGTAELEMKELFRRFGNDIVATCAFGIEINSFKDRTNAFFTLGKELTNLEGVQGIKFLAFSSFPRVMKALRLRLFSSRMTTFFRSVVMDTIAQREQRGIVRHDMINLLMQARKQELRFDENDNIDTSGEGSPKRLMDWTDDDLTAQCTVFFFGGYDTVSTLSAFMAHELAVNPDVQERLRKEIDTVRTSIGGSDKLTYETLQSMRYLDMVAYETLRKWTPAPFLDRTCSKPYVLEDYDGHKVQLQKGDGLWIPAAAIMRDPQLFPDPDRFWPERFAPDSEVPIDSATMLSFGLGPRNCIGSRFALMETKAVFFYLLTHFFLEKGPRTQHPIKLKKTSLILSAEKGSWIRFRLRDQSAAKGN